jgi:hypothetical protein
MLCGVFEIPCVNSHLCKGEGKVCSGVSLSGIFAVAPYAFAPRKHLVEQRAFHRQVPLCEMQDGRAPRYVNITSNSIVTDHLGTLGSKIGPPRPFRFVVLYSCHLDRNNRFRTDHRRAALARGEAIERSCIITVTHDTGIGSRASRGSIPSSQAARRRLRRASRVPRSQAQGV